MTYHTHKPAESRAGACPLIVMLFASLVLTGCPHDDGNTPARDRGADAGMAEGAGEGAGDAGVDDDRGDGEDGDDARACHDRCIESGRDAEACREHCANAGGDGGEPDRCEERCSAAGRAAFDECVEAGGERRDCRERWSAAQAATETLVGNGYKPAVRDEMHSLISILSLPPFLPFPA